MRLKSIGGRARPLKLAVPKPFPIPRSVSLLSQREDCDGDGGNYISESYSSGTGSDGVEKVTPDSEKAVSGDIFGGDVMEVDSMEEETCIKCSVGGQVLLCCETGCPVALHEKCAGNESLFDDEGKFYCPYCLYKRAVDRTRELREKAMEAKRLLLRFLDSEVDGSDKGKGKGKESNADGPDVSVLQRNGNCRDDEDILDNGIAENQFGQGMEPHQNHPSPHAARDNDNVSHDQEETIRGVERPGDNLERKDQCEDETSSSHQFEVGKVGEGVQADDLRVVEGKQQTDLSSACNTDEEISVDSSLNASTKQAHDVAKVPEDIPRRNKEHMQPQIHETFVSSTRVKYQRLAKQRTQNMEKDAPEGDAHSENHAERSSNDRIKKVAATRKSRQLQESTRETYFRGKRKRTPWTTEEEEMLKKGLSIIHVDVNKNIPWKKILEFGRHVFHPGRNSSDLKDHWKTLNKLSK